MKKPKKLRLLYVEDETMVAKPTITWLTRRGCTVTHADSASKAVALLEEKTFDAVLTDWNLIGFDTGALVAEEAERQQIPVRIYSGMSCQDTRWRGIWLTKGFTDDVETFLDKARG